MSYCRFGEADVYVYTSAEGIECCACPLYGGFQVMKSNTEMIAHLGDHRAAGHYVPESVFERLRDPADAAENERIWAWHRSQKANQ